MGKKFTSIFHYEKSNYQVDFQNPGVVSKFNDYCEVNDVIWGWLFDEESGQPVAKYYKELGFIWI